MQNRCRFLHSRHGFVNSSQLCNPARETAHPLERKPRPDETEIASASYPGWDAPKRVEASRKAIGIRDDACLTETPSFPASFFLNRSNRDRT